MRWTLLILFCTTLAACQKDHPDAITNELEIPLKVTIRDVHVFNPNDFIICGGDDGAGTVMKSNDGGESWVVSETPFDNSVNAMYFINSYTGYCADSDIMIYKTTDGGLTWNPFYASSWPLTVNRNLRDIWFLNDQKGFVCGGKNYGNGVLYRTQDAGNDWAFEEFTHEYRGVCFADESHGVMCGYGSLLVTSDGGETFKTVSNGDHYYTGICVDANGKFYMCEMNGLVFASTDFGRTWYKIHESDGQLFSIAVSPSGNIVAAGPNGNITISQDGGQYWWETSAENDILKVAWINDTEYLAVGKKGSVYRIKK